MLFGLGEWIKANTTSASPDIVPNPSPASTFSVQFKEAIFTSATNKTLFGPAASTFNTANGVGYVYGGVSGTYGRL
jgi:hypothetical protein